MALRDVLQAALEQLEWSDRIVPDADDDDTHYVRTSYGIRGQSYQLVFSSDERRQFLRVALYAPMTVPDHRRIEGAILVNELNLSLGVSHFEMLKDGRIALYHTVDVENAEPSPALFENMLSAVTSACSPARITALGAVVFTRLPIATILGDLEQDFANDIPVLTSSGSH